MPRSPLVEPPSSAKRDVREVVRDAIVDSFYAAHDGDSIDWLLANPALQDRFHDACREAGLIGSPADWNRELLRLRKTGEFPKRGADQESACGRRRTGRLQLRRRNRLAADERQVRRPLGRRNLLRPGEGGLLRPRGQAASPPASSRPNIVGRRCGSARPAASLVNEVKRYHFVFAKRDFSRFQTWRGFKPKRLNGQPGIYLLRGDDKSPLYIGHTLDLGRRLAQHAECPAISDEVAHVSVIAGADLPGAEYRDAFKEDLVRRYRPLERESGGARVNRLTQQFSSDPANLTVFPSFGVASST